MRTRTAHLGELNDEGKTIRVTYWPADQVFQFKVIGGEPGKLPRTYTLADLWSLVRQAEERAKPQKRDPRQLEHPSIVEAFSPENGYTGMLTGEEVPVEVRHEVLPEAGLENGSVADVQPVQEPEVGAPEPAEVRVQEPQEPGEAEGEAVRPNVSGVREVCYSEWSRELARQIILVPQRGPHQKRARIYGIEHPGHPVGNERPPVPLQDAAVDEGRDGEGGAGVA